MKSTDLSFKKEGDITRSENLLIKKENGAIYPKLILTNKYMTNITIDELQHKGIKTFGLIGTSSSIEDIGYHNQIVETYDVKLVIPERHDQLKIDDVISRDIYQGKMKSSSRVMCLKIIDKLVNQGADAIVISNCELQKIIEPSSVDVMLLHLRNIE